MDSEPTHSPSCAGSAQVVLAASARAAADLDYDEVEDRAGHPEAVVGDRVGDVHGALAEAVAGSCEQPGPQERAEKVEQEKDAEAHPAVADRRVDQRRRDRQEGGEEGGERADAGLDPGQAVEPLGGGGARTAEEPDEHALPPPP